jgi:hypothetical protein
VASLATQNQSMSSRSPLRRLGLPGQPAGMLSGMQPALTDSAPPPGAAAAAPSARVNVAVYGAAAFPVYVPEQLRSRRACAQRDPTRFVRELFMLSPINSLLHNGNKGSTRVHLSVLSTPPPAVFRQGRHWAKPRTHAQEKAARTAQGNNNHSESQ